MRVMVGETNEKKCCIGEGHGPGLLHSIANLGKPFAPLCIGGLER